MILPPLRSDLDVMASPVNDRPGILLRDFYRFSEAVLIIPPLLIPGLRLFDGRHTREDLRQLLIGSGGPEMGEVADHLAETLRAAGFLEDATYADLRAQRMDAFRKAEVREPSHAGTAYPEDVEALRGVMRGYMDGAAASERDVIAIAAPHVSPAGGWQSYRAAYQELTPALQDRTFIILGTSHYGAPGVFGLTRKPFRTPFGETTIDLAMVEELGAQPAVQMEDYCHAVEHSIEFQVIFLQWLYGPGVRIVPILCGSFGRSIHAGTQPEDEGPIREFLAALARIAEREKERVFWVLGVDMAHIGQRYGDKFSARAEEGKMLRVRERDQLRIERINAGDAAGFWDLVKQNEEDSLRWCGSSPFYTFMKAVPGSRGRLLRYEQWNIDEHSVVSFAGMAFTGGRQG
jgi:MEMO1 family protein